MNTKRRLPTVKPPVHAVHSPKPGAGRSMRPRAPGKAVDPRGRAPKTLPLFPAPVRAKVKRIALTLKPETIAALGQVAALQKRPRSTVAADLLDEMAPMLTRLAEVLRTAATASAAFPQASVERMDRMVDALAMTAEGAMAELERTVTPPTSQPAARRGRGGGRRH